MANQHHLGWTQSRLETLTCELDEKLPGIIEINLWDHGLTTEWIEAVNCFCCQLEDSMTASSTPVIGPTSHKIREIKNKVEILQTADSNVTMLTMFDGQKSHIVALQTDVDDVMNSNNNFFGQIADLQNQVDLQQQKINDYQSALEISQEEMRKFHQYKANQAIWESSIMNLIQNLKDKPSYMNYKPPKIFQSELDYKSTSASTHIAEQRISSNIMMAIPSNPSASIQAPPQNAQCSNFPSQISLQTPPLQSAGNRFKVGVLPKFDCQGNVHTFLRLYKMATVGAPDTKRAYLIINLLDPMSRDIIMPSLPAGNITYQDSRSAIIREFGSTVCMIEHKDLFSNIEFKTNETLSEFANQFYHKAQVFLRVSAMVEHNTKLAMKNAVKPYQEIYWAMNPFLGQEFTMVKILDYLCRLEATHNAPNKKTQI
ncbi:hypothetical protein DSO57_1004444 [Entomophthora muscae]|uniref:Uncharacterized protein n=1 Tax=Entomophthora muscae TaxID=34485 RepID=A0ACC2UI01_9FUNG|nr:hypothetical protein DSO57_1004444 [Entomophthora muscae]